MTALEGAEFLDRRTRISEGFFDTPGEGPVGPCLTSRTTLLGELTHALRTAKWPKNRVCGKPPENAIFPPAALRVSAGAFSYPENSSFRYTGVKCNLRHFAGFCLACFARMALARASNFSAFSPRPVLRSKAE